MRKLKVFNFVSLDGYYEGPKREISAGTNLVRKKLSILLNCFHPELLFYSVGLLMN